MYEILLYYYSPKGAENDLIISLSPMQAITMQLVTYLNMMSHINFCVPYVN